LSFAIAERAMARRQSAQETLDWRRASRAPITSV
jgi:hypothetical protein